MTGWEKGEKEWGCFKLDTRRRGKKEG